jgi:hypothetical protein
MPMRRVCKGQADRSPIAEEVALIVDLATLAPD